MLLYAHNEHAPSRFSIPYCEFHDLPCTEGLLRPGGEMIWTQINMQPCRSLRFAAWPKNVE